MNYIILCDTTYQILSAISFTLGKTKRTDRVDLVVDTLRTLNVDMHALARRIEEENIFTNVYCIGNYQVKYKRIKPIIKMLEWIMPRVIYKSMTKKITNKCEYDVVVVSGPFSTQRCLIASYPKSKLYYIEDGLGSYIGRNGINGLSWRGKIAQRIFKYSPLHIFPQVVYLYSPEFYSGEYKALVKKMVFPKNRIEMLSRVYLVNKSYVKELYSNYRFVYFSQLINSGENDMRIENLIADTFKKNFKDNIIVRPHPRGETKIYNGLNIDESFNQWELCCTEIDSKDVLISSFSTALFVPKLIYDIEPIVIFTYKLYGNNYVDNAVNRLRDFYTNKTKVKCVSSLDELVETIDTLNNEHNNYA